MIKMGPIFSFLLSSLRKQGYTWKKDISARVIGSLTLGCGRAELEKSAPLSVVDSEKNPGK